MKSTDSPIAHTELLGEDRMRAPLVAFLRARRLIGQGAVLAEELPLNGRRVDLAALSRSGITSSFELKLKSFGRVLEQAYYNSLTFQRSWIVLPSRPSPSNSQLAAEFGIGIIVVSDQVRVVVAPRLWSKQDRPAARIAARIRERGNVDFLQ